MCGCVSGEQASVNYPKAEPSESAARWTPALEMVVPDVLVTFQTWLNWENLDNANLIWRHCVEMV
jgi:hypothetical protein